MAYEIVTLTAQEEKHLREAFRDLDALSTCRVPSVRAAARAALAHVAQALNGQGLEYALYTKMWEEE